MNSKEKDKAQDAFMNDPNIKVFIGNLKASSVGLTLTAAKKLIFNDGFDNMAYPLKKYYDNVLAY